MTSRSYINFDLSIEREGARYRAHVLQSCVGQGSVKFKMPFSASELENFILKMGYARRRSGRSGRGSDSSEMLVAKEFGEKLFKMVFQGDVYACLRASLEEARTHEQGVRVLLRLPPELANVPWEYLYNSDWNRFLSLSVDTPLVRYLELTPSMHPLTVNPPLRLLVVISSPNDYELLDVEREWRDLQVALQPLVARGLVEIERLKSASLLALQHQLRRGTYHIFHFIGHGVFDEHKQDGVLLFTDEQGRGHPLSGQDLGTLLHDHHSLRLVLLNACEGARTGKDDPFAGTAQSLVQMGLPAVIAMQFEISDSSAILFAQEFYAALADGYGVDAALGDARKAIFAGGGNAEWGTPVLFSRTLNGRIFDLTPASAPEAVVQPVVMPLEPQTVSSSGSFQLMPALEIVRLYEHGVSAFHSEDWALAQDIFQSVLNARPDYRDAAERLKKTQQQLDLTQRYQNARELLKNSDWRSALQVLEKLINEAPDYRDVAELIQPLRQQARLWDLYADATRQSQAQEWQAVLDSFAEIAKLQPDYPDSHNLLPTARSRLAAVEQQETLAGLYRDALQSMQDQRWSEAQQSLDQIQQIQPDYCDVSDRLKQVQQQLDLAQRYTHIQNLLKNSDWQSALPILEKLTVEAPAYRDADHLLEQARQQSHLSELYAGAIRQSQAEEWQTVVNSFAEIAKLQLDYPDPQNLLSKARSRLNVLEQQGKLADLYQDALQSMKGQRWSEALCLLGQIQQIQPHYQDVADRVNHVKQQLDLAQRYLHIQTLLKNSDWQGALQSLEKLTAEAPGYRDTAQLIEQTHQQAHLLYLYTAAARQSQAGDWQAVVYFFAQIAKLQPDYPDPQNLLTTARSRLAVLEQQKKLADLYQNALQAMEGQHWSDAQWLLAQIQQIQPDYHDVADRLNQVRQQLDLTQRYQNAQELLEKSDWQGVLPVLEKLNNEAPGYRNVTQLLRQTRQQLHLLELYAGAIRQSQAGEWQAVVNSFAKIAKLQPDYPDPRGLLATASGHMTTPQYGTLAGCYRDALQAIEDRRWSEAVRLLNQIWNTQPGYRDVVRLLEKARIEMAYQQAFPGLAKLPGQPQPDPESLQAADPTAVSEWASGILASQDDLLRQRTLALLAEINPETGQGLIPLLIRFVENEREAPVMRARAVWSLSKLAVRPDVAVWHALQVARQPFSDDLFLKSVATWAWCDLGRFGEFGLVKVPSGEFLMGSNPESDPQSSIGERPQHSLYLPSFYIAKYPVTVSQWRSMYGSSSQRKPSNASSLKGPDDHPVTMITWTESLAYAQWFGLTLPSEAEWEKAARGTDGRIYPWGNQWQKKYANTSEYSYFAGKTTAVGQFSPNGDSPYQCVDMAGNVWEWTRSQFKPYPYAPQDGREDLQLPNIRTLRGGAFNYSCVGTRCAYRYGLKPSDAYGYVGFRVAVVPPIFIPDL
jgi:uncharacterized membrane protein YfbV (UPF0208 family)